MEIEILARIQFTFTIALHYIYYIEYSILGIVLNDLNSIK